jgi:hypothetical protein
LKNELKKLKDKKYDFKKDNVETIKKLNNKLNNYSNNIDKDTKCLFEEKNKEKIDNFNQNNEQ